MNPKVSVILPIYNVSAYLEQCMDSIVNQTLKEIEIICVDDGSTDNSLEILKKYAENDQRVIILEQSNAGAGAARNKGIEIAKGDYLSFLDSDDFFEKDMLEKAYQKACETKAQIVVFHSDQYREDEGKFVEAKWVVKDKKLPPYRPMNHIAFTDNIFKVFVGWAWDKLFERKFVEENNFRFQEQRTSNDLLFVFSAIVAAKSIEVIPDVLAHQRRNNPNSLSNTREKSWNCFYNALLELRKYLERTNCYWIHEQDYVNYALHFSLWNLDTLAGEKKEILYNKLKNEWFADLGISKHDENYFYNKKEYKKYRIIMEGNFEQYLSYINWKK